MIDEKKITQAVDAYIGYPKELGEGVEVSMRRDAFREGAKWFKEALWHDASEEPEDNKEFIMYDGENWNEITSYVHEGPYSWMQLVGTFCFIKWCYVEDILPKGGEDANFKI